MDIAKLEMRLMHSMIGATTSDFESLFQLADFAGTVEYGKSVGALEGCPFYYAHREYDNIDGT